MPGINQGTTMKQDLKDMRAMIDVDSKVLPVTFVVCEVLYAWLIWLICRM